jgi:hypothetical protein
MRLLSALVWRRIVLAEDNQAEALAISEASPDQLRRYELQVSMDAAPVVRKVSA